jgi:hypothetical protein
MAERRQPDYDFFGPGQGSPAPPGTTPRWPALDGPQQPAAGPPPSTASMPVPRRSTGLTVLVVAAVVVGAVVVMGVVSAVAIPVFLAQRMRAEWKATTFVLPETFDGATRTAVPASEIPDLSAESFGTLQVARYRTGTTSYFVVAAKGKEPLAGSEQVDFPRQLSGGMAQDGMRLSFTEKDAGKLGGWHGCGPVTLTGSGGDTGTGLTACASVDHAGVVLVLVTGLADPAAASLRLREAVERRSS